MSTRPLSIPFSILLAFVLLPALTSCAPNSAEEAKAPAPAEELEPTSQTIFGARLLLYLEHAPPVRGENMRFLAHLSVRATGEPVRSGRVVLEIGGTSLAAVAPERAGLFVPEGVVASPGEHPSRLVVECDQASETLQLEPILVHPSLDAARAVAAGEGEAPVDSVPFLMEQQWRVKLLLGVAESRSMTERLLVPAQVVTPEGAEADVAPPVEGRLLDSPSGPMPRTGQLVEAGQVLAMVEPPLSASDLAQLDALELEFQLKALDVVRAASESEVQLRFAERESARLANLRAQGLSTQQELDQAARDLALAQGAAQSAGATKKALDELLARRGSAQGSARRLPLVAPITGTVTAAPRVAGETIVSSEQVFHILDSSQLWIEGRVSEFDLARIGRNPAARATFPALPGSELDLGASSYSSPRIDPVSRTLVLRYEVANTSGELRAGLLAELGIATESAQAAVAIPREALVHDQGTPTAYVMLEGELFQKRELELGIEDGGYVEVRKGIALGEHVATRGAHVVKLAALSPTSFGPGHQH